MQGNTKKIIKSICLRINEICIYNSIPESFIGFVGIFVSFCTSIAVSMIKFNNYTAGTALLIYSVSIFTTFLFKMKKENSMLSNLLPFIMCSITIILVYRGIMYLSGAFKEFKFDIVICVIPCLLSYLDCTINVFVKDKKKFAETKVLDAEGEGQQSWRLP